MYFYAIGGAEKLLQKLKTAKKVVGVKQLRKALKEGSASEVYVAEDADPRLIDPVVAACLETGVPLLRVPTMAELGAACSIEVGAAVAAILR